MVAGKLDQSVQMGVQRELRAGRERMKEREYNFKIESNPRKSWHHAESAIVARAPRDFIVSFLLLFFSRPFRTPPQKYESPIRRVGTCANWISV